MGIEVERNTSKFLVPVSNFLESQSRKVIICSCSNFYLSCQFPPKKTKIMICYLTKQFMGDIELVNTSFDLTLMGSIFFNFSYHISRSNKTCLLYFILFFYFHFTLCCFTIVYWFCHTLT